MEIQKTEELRRYIDGLWEKFLIAGVCRDIMMGEVAGHLYVEPPETPLSPEAAEEYAAVSGFADDIRDAAIRLYESPESVGVYAELAGRMTPEDFMDAVMDGAVRLTRRYDGSVIRDNPYRRQIRLHPESAGDAALAERDTLPYEFIETGRSVYDRENPFLSGETSFFEEAVTFPALLEKDRVWMSVVLSEIETMQPDIDAARGRVITYGLGLGYYAYMAARKPEVEKVTVVELSPEVIRLFKEQILPQFPEKEKLEIIESDAYAYIRQQKDGAYDFAYADFWAGVEDGPLLYRRLLPLISRFKRTKFSCWIESAFIDLYFRPSAMYVLMEQGLLRKVRRLPVPQGITALQKDFERFLRGKPVRLAGAADIDRLLLPETMTALVREWGSRPL